MSFLTTAPAAAEAHKASANTWIESLDREVKGQSSPQITPGAASIGGVGSKNWRNDKWMKGVDMR